MFAKAFKPRGVNAKKPRKQRWIITIQKLPFLSKDLSALREFKAGIIMNAITSFPYFSYL